MASMNFTEAMESGMSISTTTTTGFVEMITSTTEIPPNDCPVYDKSDDAIIEMFSFW
jgi:hypothetical protein